MAVSVRIEDEAFSDARYDELAAYAGLADADHARSKMEHLWRQCTLEHSYVLSAFIVNKFLGANGIAALVKSRLGERVGDDKVRIKGTKGRIEWLRKLRKNKKFGKLGAEHGKRGGRPRKNPLVGVSQNPPPAPAPAPTSAPAPTKEEESGSPAGLALLFDKVDLAGGEVGQQRNTKAAKRKAAASPDHQAAIDAFHQRFKSKYGEKPDWNGKAIGLLSALIKRHSLATLVGRMDFMFAGRSKWPPGPYSAEVFVQHFDRWIEEVATIQSPLRKVEELK